MPKLLFAATTLMLLMPNPKRLMLGYLLGVSAGQTIALRDGAPIEAPVRNATALVAAVPAWLEARP